MLIYIRAGAQMPSQKRDWLAAEIRLSRKCIQGLLAQDPMRDAARYITKLTFLIAPKSESGPPNRGEIFFSKSANI